MSDANCSADHNYTGPDGTGLTRSGSCTDNAGNVGNGVSAAFKFDDTDPTVTVTPGRGPDFGGWYNAPVVFDTAGTDGTGSGVSDANCSADHNYTGPDGTGLTRSGSCTDNAGNVGNGVSAAFKFDDTDPTVTVTGVANGASYTLGSVPPAGCSTSDALSGVKTNAALQPLTGPGTMNPNGVGSFTATCSGAEDNAGNSGSVSVTYNVIYGGFVRFLQPINNTAHDLGNNPDVSTFKAGSTVPVKFQIKLPNGTTVLPSSAAWVTPQKGGPTGQPVDEASTWSLPRRARTTS